MGRLVLNVQDESDIPSVMGVSAILGDIAFVFKLNEVFNWKLKRASDVLCYHEKVITKHVLYRGVSGCEEINVFWNQPESSDWISKKSLKGTGLFSEEAAVAPLLRFLKKPKNIDALVLIEPKLSQNEMLILQKTMDTIPSIVGVKTIPWLEIKNRENLHFDL